MMRMVLIAWLVLAFQAMRGQTIEESLFAQDELDSVDVVSLAAFDSLAGRSDFNNASVDTTVVLSDSLLYAIIRIGDGTGVNALYYLLSFDRPHQRVIDLAYLCDDPDIERSLKRYRLSELGFWDTKEVTVVDYDCHVTDGGKPEEEVTMTVTNRRYWKVMLDGRIQQGVWDVATPP